VRTAEVFNGHKYLRILQAIAGQILTTEREDYKPEREDAED